jgi:hypothetical protein
LHYIVWEKKILEEASQNQTKLRAFEKMLIDMKILLMFLGKCEEGTV